MPIFNFKCEKCGKLFETLLKNRSEEAECPECGSKELLSAPNRISVGRSSNSNSCPAQAMCPGAAVSGGCGCSGCCGHKH